MIKRYGLGNYIYCIVTLISFVQVCNAQITLSNQIKQNNQIAIGINDSYYGFGTIAYNKWKVTGQSSFFSTKLNSQYWLLDGYYGLPVHPQILLSAGLSLGGKYNANPVYYSYAMIEAVGNWKKTSLSVTSFIPLYNTNTLRYKIKIQGDVYDEHIFVTGSWKPNPFFGNPQQYVSIGILFKKENLEVLPTFQLPDDWNGKQMQLLISFYYNFLK